MKSFQQLVSEELANARAKHRGLNTKHEALAVIMEEFEEFKEAVFRDMPTEESLKELIQLAAMCQRAAEDVGLIAAQ